MKTNFKTLSYLGNDYRIIVMRSQHNNYEELFYNLPTNAEIGGSEYNAIKKLYSEESGCPYCEVRPITLEKWLKRQNN